MSELGQVLKETREQKKLSLDDLQRETKIQKRYLKAIEEGDYSQLPGEFYTRAFIKNYAETLGLDFKSLSEQYPGDMPKLARQHVDTPVMPPDGSESERAQKPIRRSAVRAKNWSSFVNKALVIVFILIALMIVYILITHFAGDRSNPSSGTSSSHSVQFKGDSASSNQASSDSSSNSATDSSANQMLKKESEQGSTTTYSLSGTEKFEVTVSAAPNQTRGAWFMASDGQTNKQIVQGTVDLHGKKSYKFDASSAQSLRLRFGNVPDTNLKINGQKVDFPNKNTVQTLLINFNK
ncbi:helix-turn-helix domain-containing protein [Sporolactobacillus sp. CPB3-1]|uniref:Helix-turn-helix domain-containing protein n=1 Tax=Sporolactobacillus mangiferae TaxID=2940498 RepID=A0ABT0M7H9_9BACL|nr:helix-turn-helix domain-containing protein [Sporolactobacillus mangiferae]MCL1630827.1 helix-turn-helix domain-containing protein [Sporolactobacillus mangiferae]